MYDTPGSTTIDSVKDHHHLCDNGLCYPLAPVTFCCERVACHAYALQTVARLQWDMGRCKIHVVNHKGGFCFCMLLLYICRHLPNNTFCVFVSGVEGGGETVRRWL